MPLLKLQISGSVDSKKKESLLPALSKLLAEGLGKPEQYVMISIEENASICLSCATGPAAFAEVRSIGALNTKVNKAFSARLCAFLNDNLHIPPARVYINFIDISAGDWGWNNGTFG